LVNFDSMNVARLVSTTGADPARRDRLGMSLAASALVHVLVILIVAGLVKPFQVSQSSSLGAALPIEIAIVGTPDVAEAPAPEVSPPVVEPPPTPPPMPPEPKPLSPATTAPRPQPTAVPPPKPVVDLPPLGVSVKTDPNADAVPASASAPLGNISVVAVQDAERVGHTTSIRLAQRFAGNVSKTPTLRNSLVVSYPPDAARSYTEARIAVVAILGADGKLQEITLYPDDPQFGPFVRSALQDAQFLPAETDAKPVPYWAILEFVFSMHRPALSRRQ
jgi:hypothetical protein